jgi:hypothetical protein
MNGYPNTWLSPYTILEKIVFWREIDYDEPVIKTWVKVLTPFCEALQAIRKLINPTIRYVKIDRYDTWSMDSTLAEIILPMLKQLNETKHGAPYTDDNDVPEYLRSHMAQPKENEWDTDDLHFMRWDWILNEMIWAFEQKVNDDNEAQFFDYSQSNGKSPWDKDYVGPKLDFEGLTKHNDRMQNGFRLFGRYYQNLWD